MNSLIASIDQGTTSTRCVLFSSDGGTFLSQKEHKQHYPHPGYVEHDPLEIWRNTQHVIADALAKASASPTQIAAVGITNQRETTVVWDKRTGQPLHHAIVWQDTRTKSICDAYAKDGGPDRFRPLTGLPLATYFSAPKLKWLLDHVPNLRSLAAAGHALFGTIDSWLLFNLTGQHVTDPTNASRTMLMNLHTLDWDDSLLASFDIPRQMLPKIIPSSHPTGFGHTLPTGPFSAAIPVTGVLGDQHAALVGQNCLTPGSSKNTYGTGCFMLLHTGDQPVVSKHGLLTTVAYQFHNEKPAYALEGSVAVAGALIQWLRDNLNLITTAKEIEPLASSVPNNGGVYFVPAFSGLFAPYWRSDARGTIVGLSQHSSRAHIARAALESTAFQTLDVLLAMQNDSPHTTPTTLKVDGGMTANSLLMQFQSDLLGIPVSRPKFPETTVLGAAIAAARAVGITDFFSHHCQPDATWTPSMSADQRASLHAHWKKAIDRSLHWLD
ncbi:MAG TPA: glycerol kinase GlpK [Tepidisphaeraceae bacterium]|jgi:glycerol kinase|nr:glycerol kinase GlpK [Tepidisphaeraceae bacterium]